jgi:hypothetical protein
MSDPGLRTRGQRAAFMASLKGSNGSPTTPRQEFEPTHRAASPTPFLLNAPSSNTPNKRTKPTWRVDYGFFETQGRRDEMEDAHSITENDQFFMWALFDGYVTLIDRPKRPEWSCRFYFQHFEKRAGTLSTCFSLSKPINSLNFEHEYLNLYSYPKL